MIEINPKPARVNWGEIIGNACKTNLKGRVECWDGFYASDQGLLHGTIEVDLYLEECMEAMTGHCLHPIMVNVEGYYLKVMKKSESQAIVWIYAKSRRGYYYAFLTWQQMLAQPLYETEILDQPRMPFRGIVEGYYGKPWTAENRLRAIRIMSGQKMNTYIYAPKNDRYHRDLWAVSYPKEEERELVQLISTCNDLFVDFVFTLSPGYSIQYSSSDDLSHIIRKFKQLYQHGVRFFGVFFDDIPLNLYHKQDIERFGELVQAQIYFILHVFAELKKLDLTNQLMICPTLYFGEGNEAYIITLGRNLSEEIFILWTGRRICSTEISAREARIFYEYTHHKPFLWDNYPVNDANMRDEMHIGPLLHREPSLFLYSSGYVANVMEYAEASLIPLITAGHYLWNPEDYQPEASFSYAVRIIVGKEYNEFIWISDCINQSSISPLPGNQLMSEWFHYRRLWGTEEARLQFNKIILTYREKVQALLNMENEQLRREMKPWLEQLVNDFDYLLRILTITGVEDPTKKKRLVSELKLLSTTIYEGRAKTLGFFPYLIANVILEQE